MASADAGEPEAITSRLRPALKWAKQPARAAYYAAINAANDRRRRGIIEAYLARPGFHGLNVGCGDVPVEGWLNTDVPGTARSKADFYLDITRPLPFPDASLDAIYAEEVIEHIPRDEVGPFLREARRVLRPGGAIRMTTPDAEGVCRLFLGQVDPETTKFVSETWVDGTWDPETWVNAMFRNWGHQFIWTERLLREVAESAGFERLERCPPHVTRSGVEKLNGLDNRYGPDAPPAAHAYTLIAEAIKPK